VGDVDVGNGVLWKGSRGCEGKRLVHAQKWGEIPEVFQDRKYLVYFTKNLNGQVPSTKR